MVKILFIAPIELVMVANELQTGLSSPLPFFTQQSIFPPLKGVEFEFIETYTVSTLIW